MSDVCSEQHALVGQFAFHLERLMLTMSDGTEEEGAVLELCPPEQAVVERGVIEVSGRQGAQGEVYFPPCL